MIALQPQDQVFWYLKREAPKQLRTNIKTDIVIVGGGMAGLSAAHAFHNKGLKVVLLEKSYCGAGASGKTSGFITPNSEIDLSKFVKNYGPAKAKKIWEFDIAGVEYIRNNINQFSLQCDYFVQDTLMVANSHGGYKVLEKEYNARKQLGYESMMYSDTKLPEILGSQNYYGGIRYGGSFGINGYRYCQGMRDVLLDKGVDLYEETPVVAFDNKGVNTPYSRVDAEYIIVCADRFIPDFGVLTKDIYHYQTFLMMSAPLSDDQVKQIFPQKPMLVWDTDMIYHYFRLTADNRLLVGGANMFSSYARDEHHHDYHIAGALKQYIIKKFPTIPFNFEYFWPGLLGISKDLVPIAGPDLKMPHVYYIGAATGLSWAAALGNYSAEKLLNNRTDFDDYFCPTRKFPIGHGLQTILGTKITFAVSNLFSVYLK